MEPKLHKMAPTGASGGSGMAPERSHWQQEGPKWPHGGSKRSQDGPRRLQVGPKEPQDGLIRFQYAPKMAPRASMRSKWGAKMMTEGQILNFKKAAFFAGFSNENDLRAAQDDTKFGRFWQIWVDFDVTENGLRFWMVLM